MLRSGVRIPEAARPFGLVNRAFIVRLSLLIAFCEVIGSQSGSQREARSELEQITHPIGGLARLGDVWLQVFIVMLIWEWLRTSMMTRGDTSWASMSDAAVCRRS